MGNALVSDILSANPFRTGDLDGLAACTCEKTGAKFFDDHLRPISFLKYPEENWLQVHCPECNDFHKVTSGPAPRFHPKLQTWTESAGEGTTNISIRMPLLPT